MEFKAGHHL